MKIKLNTLNSSCNLLGENTLLAAKPENVY